MKNSKFSTVFKFRTIKIQENEFFFFNQSVPFIAQNFVVIKRYAERQLKNPLNRHFAGRYQINLAKSFGYSSKSHELLEFLPQGI